MKAIDIFLLGGHFLIAVAAVLPIFAIVWDLLGHDCFAAVVAAVVVSPFVVFGVRCGIDERRQITALRRGDYRGW